MVESIKAKYAAEIKQKLKNHADDVTKADPLTEQKIKDARSDRKLKNKYATWFVLILVAQLIVMNLVFVLVGFGFLAFDEWALNLYMAGTLAEVFGVILVITSNLFPKKA